ncbi:hypothetical protein [Nubsella zeaxanthinifaciens]|uniref:hypothetical protein n=1 Tax=Nubsella zeaxanthinifaciens TaxID=392412 RepID=UPI00130043F3|nr:hypothetical protein [Nubsella zeaxanthinifaciens]
MLENLFKNGQLPTVTVDVRLNRENMTDLAVTAIIAALVVILLYKTILSKL